MKVELNGCEKAKIFFLFTKKGKVFVSFFVYERVGEEQVNVKKFKSFFHYILWLNQSLFSLLLFFLGIIKSEKPFFDEIYPRNISTVIDDVAILKCVVKNKGDRTVSKKYLCKEDKNIFVSLLAFGLDGEQRDNFVRDEEA